MSSTRTPTRGCRTPWSVSSALSWRSECVASPAPGRAEPEPEQHDRWSSSHRVLGGSIAHGGAPVPPRRPSWRSRVLGGIARRFGPELVLATIAAKEEVDQNAYLEQPETATTRMSAQERWHAKVLKQLVATQRRGLEGSFLGRLEGRHRSVGGNALRAAVLGANDGLCSNLSLVM